jgi:hypothetical protein
MPSNQSSIGNFQNKIRQLIRISFLPIACCAFSSVVVPSNASAQDRPAQLFTWTDSTGKNKTEAEFVKLDGVKLVLRKADGKEITITLNKLDDRSRLKARSIAKNGLDSLSSEGGPIAAAAAPVVFPSNPSAAEFKDIVLRELKNKNFLVVWDALPAGKQKQVEDLVKLASTKIEQRTLDQVKRFRTDLLTMLKSKKDFVLNSKVLPIPPNQRAILVDAYDPFVGLIESYISIDLLELKNLQETSLRDLVSNYVGKIAIQADAFDSSIPASSPLKQMASQASQLPDDFKIEPISAKEVMVTPIQAGKPPSNKLKFVLSDGRWLPADLVGQWEKTMAQANQAIESADPKVIHRAVGQGIFGATALMGAFAAAETQEDFDDALQQAMSNLQAIPGLMPGGMSPPGGPGGPNRQNAPPKKQMLSPG